MTNSTERAPHAQLPNVFSAQGMIWIKAQGRLKHILASVHRQMLEVFDAGNELGEALSLRGLRAIRSQSRGSGTPS